MGGKSSKKKKEDLDDNEWDNSFRETKLSSNKCDACWEKEAGERATFAMGSPCSCAKFGAMDEVIRCKTGFTGGKTKRPTFKKPGDHVLAVQIEFVPREGTYHKLLEIFWKGHDIFDPEVKSRIYWHNETQKTKAEKEKSAIEKKYGPTTTQILKYSTWVDAAGEDQHILLQNNDEAMHLIGRRIKPHQMAHSHLAARLEGYLGGYGTRRQFNSEEPDLYICKDLACLIREHTGLYRRGESRQNPFELPSDSEVEDQKLMKSEPVAVPPPIIVNQSLVSESPTRVSQIPSNANKELPHPKPSTRDVETMTDPEDPSIKHLITLESTGAINGNKEVVQPYPKPSTRDVGTMTNPEPSKNPIPNSLHIVQEDPSIQSNATDTSALSILMRRNTAKHDLQEVESEVEGTKDTPQPQERQLSLPFIPTASETTEAKKSESHAPPTSTSSQPRQSHQDASTSTSTISHHHHNHHHDHIDKHDSPPHSESKRGSASHHHTNHDRSNHSPPRSHSESKRGSNATKHPEHHEHHESDHHSRDKSRRSESHRDHHDHHHGHDSDSSSHSGSPSPDDSDHHRHGGSGHHSRSSRRYSHNSHHANKDYRHQVYRYVSERFEKPPKGDGTQQRSRHSLPTPGDFSGRRSDDSRIPQDYRDAQYDKTYYPSPPPTPQVPMGAAQPQPMPNQQQRYSGQSGYSGMLANQFAPPPQQQVTSEQYYSTPFQGAAGSPPPMPFVGMGMGMPPQPQAPMQLQGMGVPPPPPGNMPFSPPQIIISPMACPWPPPPQNNTAFGHEGGYRTEPRGPSVSNSHNSGMKNLNQQGPPRTSAQAIYSRQGPPRGPQMAARPSAPPKLETIQEECNLGNKTFEINITLNDKNA